jgi:hypothetical protein
MKSDYIEELTEASALQIACIGRFRRTRIIIGCPLSLEGFAK